jgi:hypothetical protein
MIAAGPAARLESFRCHAAFWFRNAAESNGVNCPCDGRKAFDAAGSFRPNNFQNSICAGSLRVNVEPAADRLRVD